MKTNDTNANRTMLCAVWTTGFIIAKVCNRTTHCIGQVPQFDEDVDHPYGLSASGTPASGVNAKGALGFNPTG